MKLAELRVGVPELFCRLLALRGPALPQIHDHKWEEGLGLLRYLPYAMEFPEETRAAWAHFGFHFTSSRHGRREHLPDMYLDPSGEWIHPATGRRTKAEGPIPMPVLPPPEGPPHPLAWMETFPKDWATLLERPLFLLLGGRLQKGHSAAARYFLHHLTIRGRRVLYLDFTFFADSPGAGWKALKREMGSGNSREAVVLDHVDRCDAPTFQHVLDLLLRAPDRGLQAVATGWPGKPLEGYQTLSLPELTLPQLLKAVFLPGLSASATIHALQQAGGPGESRPGEILFRMALSEPPPARLSEEAFLTLKALALEGGTLPSTPVTQPVRKELEAEGWAREVEGNIVPSRPASPGRLSAREAESLLKKVWFKDAPVASRLFVERLARPGPDPRALAQKLETAAREGDVFQLHELHRLSNHPEAWAPFLSGWEGDLERFVPLFQEHSSDATLQLLAFLFEWENMADGVLEGRLPKEWRRLLQARTLKKEGQLQSALNLLQEAAGPGADPPAILASLILADTLAENGMRDKATALFDRCRDALSRQPPVVQAYYYRFLAYFFFTIGRLKDARDACLRWQSIAAERGWLWQEALAWNDLGVIANEMEDRAAARKAFAAAARFAQALGEAKRLNLIHFNLAEVALQEGALSEAEEIFLETARVNRERQDNRGLFFDLIQLGRIWYLQGRHGAAGKAANELDSLYAGLPVHPWAGKLLILKAELAKWGELEGYMRALKSLKGFAFPIAQDKTEAARLITQGILRKALTGTPAHQDIRTKTEKDLERVSWRTPPLDMNSQQDLILLLEWDRFYPGKVPAAAVARAFDGLKAQGAAGWEQILRPRVDLSLMSLFSFLSGHDFDPASSPLPFEITLPGGQVHSHGTLEGERSLELPNGTVLKIPGGHVNLMPLDFWIIWGLSLQSRVAARLKTRPDILTHNEPQVFHGFVYACPKSAQAVWQAQKFARTAIPVHLAGETGSGKEVLALAIHKSSARRTGPFVPINCAAIPESLFEAELFGWRKGAFTGALLDRAGIIETAHGGTLFMDEVGDMPPLMQAKLLRVLNDRRIQRLGDTGVREVDFRLITATNRNLRERIREGAFREDLYFRIAVGVVELPPLRDRREDVPFIARALVEKNRNLFDLPHVDLHPLFLSYLMEQDWPGNVRELENFLLGCLVHVQQGEPLSLEHTPSPRGAEKERVRLAGNYTELIREYRRKIILQALEQCSWSRPAAARLLNITPQALGYQIRELGIKKEL